MAGKSNKTLQAEAKAAEAKAAADAKARTAEAEARAAEARAKADAARAETEARAAAAKLDADNRAAEIAAQKAKQDAADKLASERAAAKQDAQTLRTASTLVAIGGGIGFGHWLAHTIDHRFVRGVAAKNAALVSVATVTGSGRKALGAIATAADKAGITRAANPVMLGLATAGLAGALVAEAAFARYSVSPGLEDSPEAQAIVDASATGSVMAAAALVGQQAINMATPSAVLDAKALAHVEAARVGKTLAEATPPAAVKPGTVEVPKQIVPKPGTKAAMVLEAKQLGIAAPGKMKAGELAAAIQAAGKGSSLATRVASKLLPALGVVVAGGAAMSAFQSSAEAGESKITSAAKAAAAGLDSFVLAGAGQQMVDLQRRHVSDGRSEASLDAAAAEMGSFVVGASESWPGRSGAGPDGFSSGRSGAGPDGFSSGRSGVGPDGFSSGRSGASPDAAGGRPPAPEKIVSGRLALARAAAARAAVAQRVTQTLTGPVAMAGPGTTKPKRAKAAGKPGPDGWADAYPQVRGGRVVQVRGYKVTR